MSQQKDPQGSTPVGTKVPVETGELQAAQALPQGLGPFWTSHLKEAMWVQGPTQEKEIRTMRGLETSTSNPGWGS